MQWYLESVFLLFPNSGKHKFRKKHFWQDHWGNLHRHVLGTTLLRITGYSNIKLDLYVLQIWSKKYWATTFSFSQQIRLRGCGSYLLLTFILTLIKDFQFSLKLKIFAFQLQLLCLLDNFETENVFWNNLVLSFDTAGVDINSALI